MIAFTQRPAVKNTLADQIRAAFDFSVDKFPLTGPEGMATGVYGLFRSDTMEFIGNGSVTSRYTPHTVDDVIAPVEAVQHVFGGCQAECHFRDGHHVVLSPSKKYRRDVYGTQDNVFPRLIVRAGFDGCFQVTMGYYRDLCRNMAMLHQVRGTSVKFRHTASLHSNIDDYVEQLQGLRSGWDSLGEIVDRMESQTVMLDSFLDRVYGTPDDDANQRSKTIHRNRTRSIMRRVMRERQKSGRGEMNSNFDVTIWEAFNAVQGYTQHDATRRGNPTNYDRIVMAADDAAVKKAEAISLEICA